MNREDAKGAKGGEEGELVFVYGTLRKGASNHFRLADAEYYGPAMARGTMYLIDWYPGLVLGEDGEEVAGEVYRVTPELMKLLDEFEGAAGPGGEFRRIRTIVNWARGHDSVLQTREVWVWEYRRSIEGKQQVPRNDWRGRENKPLFLWVAWSPLIFLPVAVGIWYFHWGGSMPWWSGNALAIVAPIVMVAAGGMALQRREGPDGCAHIPFFLGLAWLLLLIAALMSSFL